MHMSWIVNIDISSRWFYCIQNKTLNMPPKVAQKVANEPKKGSSKGKAPSSPKGVFYIIIFNYLIVNEL